MDFQYYSKHGNYYGFVIGASLGTGNRGVSALGTSVVKLLREASSDSDVGMLLGHRTSEPFTIELPDGLVTVPVVNYRTSPRALGQSHIGWIMLAALLHGALPFSSWRRWLLSATPWLKSAVEADFVGDIRGGDSFSDIYGMRRYLEGSLPILAILWTRGHIAQLPQTYGPFETRPARWIARYILKRSSMIVSRDQESMGLVKELCGPDTQVHFCPDVAFALNPILPETLAIDPPLPVEKPACLIGLNVNGLVYNGGYTRSNMFGLKLDYRAFLPELVKILLQDPNAHLLLTPHTFGPPDGIESDPTASRRLMESLPPELSARTHLVTAEYDQHRIKGVIGLCDFFLGTRMHSCIAALSQEIPAVGIAYSKKFQGVFASVDGGDWIVDARTATNAEALAKAEKLFAQRESMRAVLQKSIPRVQAQLRETFKALVEAERRGPHAGHPTS